MTGERAVAVWCAALCAAAAAWALCGRDDALHRARLMFASGGRVVAGPPVGPRWSAWGAWAGAGLERGRAWLRDRWGVRVGREALCVPAGLLFAGPAHSPLPALAGLIAAPLLGRRLRARERRLEAQRWQEAVAALCAAVAADLRAGRPPDIALCEAVDGLRGPYGPGGPGAARAASGLLAAARFGGDVPAALRHAARGPGAEGLVGVAACWEVAVDGGAGLADGLDRVATALRAERDQREDLCAQLAGPRSTVVMLALLPVFAVALGCAMGADPPRVLLRTPAGLGCLLIGGLLEWAGLVWTAKIVRAAEEA